jgi:glutaredoxin
MHCNNLKNKLTEETIEFVNIDIEQNQQLWNSLTSQTKLNFVPQVFIKKEGTNDGPVFVPSRDFNSIDEIVEIIKKYI